MQMILAACFDLNAFGWISAAGPIKTQIEISIKFQIPSKNSLSII